MASAAAAKKCRGLSHRCCADWSTSRTYASWTRAVACSVWPGFSWASFRRQPPQFARRPAAATARRPGVAGCSISRKDAGDVGHGLVLHKRGGSPKRNRTRNPLVYGEGSPAS